MNIQFKNICVLLLHKFLRMSGKQNTSSIKTHKDSVDHELKISEFNRYFEKLVFIMLDNSNLHKNPLFPKPLTNADYAL